MNNIQDVASNKRRQVNFASGCNIVLGAWLIISPFIFGYSRPGPLWNNIIVGAVVLILAWVRLANRSATRAPSWWNAILGIWMIIAPFAIGYHSTATTWNDVIVGVLVLILGVWSGSVIVPPPTAAHA